MTNMNSETFRHTVDHVAAMNDRWLFLAAICLLLVGCGVVIYWLVNNCSRSWPATNNPASRITPP